MFGVSGEHTGPDPAASWAKASCSAVGSIAVELFIAVELLGESVEFAIGGRLGGSALVSLHDSSTSGTAGVAAWKSTSGVHRPPAGGAAPAGRHRGLRLLRH